MLKNISTNLLQSIKSKNIANSFIEQQLLTQFSVNLENDNVYFTFPKPFFEDSLLQKDKLNNDIVLASKFSNKNVALTVNKNKFIRDTLKPPEPKNLLTLKPQSIIVEYSSPNVAKPFHVGNLRSTIIGNFISNINSYIGHNVTRLNYLGDWGTQFGYLNVGIEILNLTDEDIKKDPINLLYKAYVTAHELSKTDNEIANKARKIFSDLENNQYEHINRWKSIKKFTINELENTYCRIGVNFDQYDWESMYGSNDIKLVIDLLNSHKLLKTDIDGRQIIEFDNRTVTFLKSDQSSLYISRDVAAALDRYKKYKFDRMLYIVDNAQTDHFVALKYILKNLKYDWARNVDHIKFGRVHGMSTRKGTAVFLKDILDEARDLMRKKQTESPTTKVSIDDERISDILGVSCVIINDLKQRRQKSYNFDWNKILQTNGDCGTKLQYTHCRLSNLMKHCGVTLPEQCEPELLSSSPEAMALIVHIANYYPTLYRSYNDFEACILVNYLFQLCNLTSRALKVLRVKDEEHSVAQQRLLLFFISKIILHDSMKILGLEPLNEM